MEESKMETKKTKIIMIGALSIQYIRDNWVVPMRKLFDTTFVDVSPILSIYRNTDYVEKYIYAILEKDQYDYMFFYSDAINPDFSDDFFKRVREKGIPIVNFLADDEPEIWYKQNLPYDHRYDLIATHSQNGYLRRVEMGKADNFIYLPWGYSEELFDRVPGIEQIYDVIYIGSNLCQEHDPNLYFSDGYKRQKLLVSVYDFCRHQGLIFSVFGAGWHRHPVLTHCNGGMLTNDEMVNIYSQAKIVLNPGYSADDSELHSYQTKLRHFEVAGCGAFQLVNHNPELKEIFKPGEDIVYFHDTHELKEKIKFYIEHELHRQQIANNIYKKRHLHTTTYRLHELFNQATNRFATQENKRITYKRNPRVKTLRYQNPNQAKEELSRLEPKSELLEGYEAVHIITGDFHIYNIEYSPWRTDKIPSELPVMATQTYLQLTSLYVNPIQRKKQNMLGIMLDEKIEKSTLHPWLQNYLKEQCFLLEDDNFIYPLMNIIIPLHRITEIIDIFLRQDINAFKNLHPEISGLVVTDLEIKPGILPEELANPPYILKLQKLLEKIKRKDERIMIYGAKGNMTDYVLKLLARYPDIEIIGFFDRAMAGQKVNNIPVYRFEEIDKLNPTMIIIAAESSGFAIYESIKHIEFRITLVPLHDLTNPIWKQLATDG